MLTDRPFTDVCHLAMEYRCAADLCQNDGAVLRQEHILWWEHLEGTSRKDCVGVRFSRRRIVEGCGSCLLSFGTPAIRFAVHSSPAAVVMVT